MDFVNICGIGLGHCALHYVITACAAASLLYRRLKRAHWQGIPGRMAFLASALFLQHDKNIYPEVHEPALSIHLYGHISTSTRIRNAEV